MTTWLTGPPSSEQTHALGGEPIRSSAPAQTAVSLSAALAHARLGLSPDDLDVVLQCLNAAIGEVEQYTGLGLITQTWQQTFSRWPSFLLLRRRPLIALGSPATAVTVTYRDADNASQEFTDIVVTGVGGDKVAGTVRLGYGASWPALYSHPEAVTVSYTVGYGSTHASVPALIKQAILLEFGKFYEQRESVTPDRLMGELSFASKSLLHDWRPLAVA